jgi:hypothetical protein
MGVFLIAPKQEGFVYGGSNEIKQSGVFSRYEP